VLPDARLKAAGASEAELGQLRAEYDAASEQEQHELILFFEQRADSDIREWLERQRAAGHFNPGSEPAAEPSKGEAASEEPPPEPVTE
jgi:hypothetical protein